MPVPSDDALYYNRLLSLITRRARFGTAVPLPLVNPAAAELFHGTPSPQLASMIERSREIFEKKLLTNFFFEI